MAEPQLEGMAAAVGFRLEEQGKIWENKEWQNSKSFNIIVNCSSRDLILSCICLVKNAR